MQINNISFNASLEEILDELVAQLRLNNIPYIQKMKPTRHDIQVCCPYHKGGVERRPSAGIRRTDGLFHCLACGETHSLQEVISYCFGYYDDIVGAFGWKWLLKNFATIQVEERKDVEIDLVRTDITNKSSEGDNKSSFVTEEELDAYRFYHPYWAKRRITDENIIELFDLGYDKTTNCITFPVRDIKGNCLFVARRNVRTKFFNYPEGVVKPVYGLYELHNWSKYDITMNVSSAGNVIVCESMIDALTCWQYGSFAVALNGLGNELQFKQLRDLPCRHLILATDNDGPGLQARQRIRANIRNKIITEYVFPVGKKDINDLNIQEFRDLQEIF